MEFSYVDRNIDLEKLRFWQKYLYYILWFIIGRIGLIEMSEKDYFDENSYNLSDSQANNLMGEDDLVMEQILENINNTSIGQVLKKIAMLPEVRKKKVLGVRQQLNNGDYIVTKRLDVVLDKVLEDITS